MAEKGPDGWNQSTKVDAKTSTVAPSSHHAFGKGFADEHQSTQTSKSTSPKDARSNNTRSKGSMEDFERHATQATRPPGFGKPNPPGVALPGAWRRG